MKKQTAVEWLVQQTKKQEWFTIEQEKFIEQAKQIEKEQIMKAVNELQWNTGFRTKCENLLIAFDQMKQALRQQPVSGSLQDRLFELANDFAKDKQGDVAVKLHSIHNGLQ